MIGTQIRNLRIKNKLSISELALRAGVAKSYLSQIERNIRNNPSIEFLEKVSAVLNVDIHSLIQDKIKNVQKVDNEWIELIQEVQMAGVTKKQFREFSSMLMGIRNKNTNA